MTRFRCAGLVLLAASALLAPAGGAGAVPHPSILLAGEADYVAAKALIEARDFEGALRRLAELERHYPREAEIYSLKGFALRKLRRYDEALPLYLKALSLDPDHLGANEYLGELYAETGRLPLAEERLAVLRRLCPAGCEEAEDLREAIAAARGRTRP
ncbi:MAG TPA: tetratricopeptide repeat protein [Microvirga sp.]|nr:tetratricopeptide repeat protein [Microvirga sp.]